VDDHAWPEKATSRIVNATSLAWRPESMANDKTEGFRRNPPMVSATRRLCAAGIRSGKCEERRKRANLMTKVEMDPDTDEALGLPTLKGP